MVNSRVTASRIAPSLGVMNPDVPSLLYGLSVWTVPVLLAITLHEAAHAYVAWRCGDDTGRLLGRISLDPRRHIDPVGTILLPGILILMGAPFLFGYAQPVPVNQGRLRRPRRDMMLVAAAGPAANVAQAIVALVLLKLVNEIDGSGGWLAANLSRMVVFNVALAVFNLLPIPPLDGAHIAIGLLPPDLSRSMKELMPHGMVILIGLVVVLPSIGHRLGIDLDMVGGLARAISEPVLDGLVWVFG